MTEIRVLDENTINKIAAGEVVERPASVIKELVENSIDAGATRIEVEIMSGGTSLMRVTDNGRGMTKEDAKAALMRHATSKLKSVQDLQNLGTLGFRGEALPTIASVSRFSMLTRTEGEELGVKVSVTGGRESDFSAAGCGVGTTIKAEDLFFNTPARKKFLKTTYTEAGKISDFLIKLALSRPDIAFRFISNNKLSMTTPGNGSLSDTIKSIYGVDIADALLPVSFADENISIDGYITKPSTLKSSRAWQTMIVNGRIIKNLAIIKAIDNAYRSKIPKTGYPLAVIVIKVPPNSIDINVHPQKMEMKFDDENRVFKAVFKAVSDAIQLPENSLQNAAATAEKIERHYETMPIEFAVHEPISAQNFAPPEEKILPPKSETYIPPPTMQAPAPPKIADEKPIPARQKQNGETNMDFTGGVYPIGQVDKCYIIAKDLKGLYIVDQHAAHERILFDKFSGMADGIPSQQLLVHIIIHFDDRDTKLVENNLSLFHKLGFSLLASGENEFRLTEVPSDIHTADAEDVIREILAELHDMHAVTAKEIRAAALATMACRAAIKSGDELNTRQMQIVLEELSRTAYPFTCPHGRPTILKFSTDELAKMFKRTGF